MLMNSTSRGRKALALSSLLIGAPVTTFAFTKNVRQHDASFVPKANLRSAGQAVRTAHGRPPLRMSSIGHDDESNNGTGGRDDDDKRRFSWRDMLPPPPEDQLAMSGDVGSIFLFTFLDHTLNDVYVEMINADEVVSTAGAVGTFDGDFAAAAAHTQLPVWYDTVHSAFGPAITTKTLPVLHATYAPIISTAGGAACLLTAAWILSGYFTGVFLFRNTLECSTPRALSAAGKTWVLATAIVVAAALASDQVLGWCDCVRTPSLGGLTKADGDFIFSSLSVLVAWRYILNSMLGYGER